MFKRLTVNLLLCLVFFGVTSACRPMVLTTDKISISPASLSFSAILGSTKPAAASLTVTDSSGTALDYTVASDQAWLAVSPSQGNWPQLIRVSPSIDGLLPGTYTAHITFASSESSDLATVTAVLRISAPTPPPAPAPPLPPPPQAPVRCEHKVHLSWVGSNDPGIVAYDVYRSTISGGPYGLEASAILGETYTDSSVQCGVTYYYVATSVNQQGIESEYSREAKAVIPPN